MSKETRDVGVALIFSAVVVSAAASLPRILGLF